MARWFANALIMMLAGTFLAGCAGEQAYMDGPAPMPAPSTPMPASYSNVEPPAGFISFCIRYPDQCSQPKSPSNTVTLNAANWTILNTVNDRVNRSIAPEDDLEHYGRAEYWTIPTDGLGVCHDYAVTKRQALINAGIPELALRIAVVVIPDGERHAVLTVATDQGDYVLDSLRDEIRPWDNTDYTWIKRQAANSAWNWVALNGNPNLEVASTTGATSSAQ